MSSPGRVPPPRSDIVGPMIDAAGHPVFPTPLDAYPVVDGGLLATLAARLHANPFNAVVTGIFVLAILHTFMAARFSTMAHDVQHRHDEARRRAGLGPQPSLPAELLHFVGEVEVVFGLWAIVLLVAMTAHLGWDTATALLQRHGELHRADVRRGHHGAGLDTAGRRVCRGGAAARRQPRPRHAGGVVAVDSDHRPGARVVHHRAGRDDDLRAAAGAPVLRPAAVDTPRSTRRSACCSSTCPSAAR